MDIGNKIQTIRTDYGMTQAEFADKFHVARQTVSNWENNKNYPDLGTLRQISDEYGVSFDTLLKEDQEYISHIDKTSDQAVKAVKGIKILIPLVIILLIAAIAFAIHQYRLGSFESGPLPGIDEPNYMYPVNENGQTYGLDWMGDDYEEHAPDLIAAAGVNGKKGYVKRIDLEETEGASVNTPEEADAYMERKSQRRGKNYYIVIPVFKEDGVTEIDQFWIYNGAGEWSAGEGDKQVSVPDLSGMTRDDAEETLIAAGLELGNIAIQTSDEENGKVTGQEPAAGTNLGTGSRVDITIGD